MLDLTMQDIDSILRESNAGILASRVEQVVQSCDSTDAKELGEKFDKLFEEYYDAIGVSREVFEEILHHIYKTVSSDLHHRQWYAAHAALGIGITLGKFLALNGSPTQQG